MSVQAKEEPKPIANVDLPTELEEKFHDLMDEIYELFAVNGEETIEEAGRVMCEHIQREVSAYPILAKAVDKDLLGWSLLTTVCEKTYSRNVGHDAIKYLINMNPHALIWRWGDKYQPSSPLREIASNRCHCVLLPWIAQHHGWIFDHPTVLKQPPHYELVRNYANGACSASVVRSFYEKYPKGLQQKDKIGMEFSPLHVCLTGWEECDAELFEWMAKQYPEAISRRNRFGETVLHAACGAMSSSVEEDVSEPSHCTENMARICRFLVSEYPKAVGIKGSRSGLPLHYLARRCNRPLVQDLVILMLKQYPQAIKTKAAKHLPNLSDVPFIQQILPLLQHVAHIQEERCWLSKASTNFGECGDLIENDSFSRVNDTFTSWATARLDGLEAKENETQHQIIQVELRFEGEDVNSDVEEEESDDEDDEEQELGGEDEEDEESNDEDDFDFWKDFDSEDEDSE